MRPDNRKLVVCVKNFGYEASLELRKIYVSLVDADAEAQGQLRVIDESGDDYLFPGEFFVPADSIGPEALRAIDAA